MTASAKLTATIRTSHRGNLALQSETFRLPLSLAIDTIRHLDTRTGCYWESARKAVMRAKREKAETVVLYTAGFGTSELAGAIQAAGGTTVCLPD